LLSKCAGSVDAERRFSSSSQAHDASQVLLPKLHESVGSPNHSSVLQHDDDDDDDEVAANDSDSKEEVGFCHIIIIQGGPIITVHF